MSDNPKAFPSGSRYSGELGMTLRDWFAGQAFGSLTQMVMPGLTKNPAFPTDESAFALLAEKAYSAADAMLEARKDKP